MGGHALLLLAYAGHPGSESDNRDWERHGEKVGC